MDIVDIINDFIEDHKEGIRNLSSYELKSLMNYQKLLNEYSETAEDGEREPLLVFLEFVNEQEKKINEYYARYENPRYEDSSNFLDCQELCECIEKYLEKGVFHYQYDDLIYCDETSLYSGVEEFFKDELRGQVFRQLDSRNLSDYFDYDGYLDGFCDIFDILKELDIYHVTKYPEELYEELYGEAIYIIGDRSYALR